MFELGDAMGSVMDDEDATAVGLGWISKSMPSSHFEVLAHRVMLLLIEVCFDEHIDLISCPIPVEGVLAEGCDVGHIQPRKSGLLGWCAVKWWIEIWTLWRR